MVYSSKKKARDFMSLAPGGPRVGTPPFSGHAYLGIVLPASAHSLAVLFDLFVREVAERIEEYSSGSFVGLRGDSECDLKFSFGHVLAFDWIDRTGGGR
jgi:hypothetical protein